MDELEKQAIQRGQKIAFAERLFWVAVTAFSGFIFFMD